MLTNIARTGSHKKLSKFKIGLTYTIDLILLRYRPVRSFNKTCKITKNMQKGVILPPLI